MINYIYKVSEGVIIEVFEDAALVLRMEDRKIINFNLSAYHVLEKTDGVRTVAEVAKSIADNYKLLETEALQDVKSSYQHLETQKIVELVSEHKKEFDGMNNTRIMEKKYLCNPDVVLREEDESGGLLFNPDTNQVKVINTTGLFIWKQFASENSPKVVAQALEQTFEDAPEEQLKEDLQEFLAELIQTGFVGEVEI